MALVSQSAAADRAAMVADLVSAFQDDPVVSWVFPDSGKRRRFSRHFFDLHARRSTATGLAWRTDGGAALWDPPGAWKTTALDDALLALRSARGTGVRHGLVAGRALLGMEARHPADEHLYLPVLGVRAGRQGRGLGGALLEPGLAYADRHRLPCYLESSNPRNVPFYERHGFEVTGEHRLADGPVVSFMWRKAG